MSKNTKNTTVDIDYADQAVPKEGRKGFLTMFMIMLGFTFFSAIPVKNMLILIRLTENVIRLRLKRWRKW